MSLNTSKAQTKTSMAFGLKVSRINAYNVKHIISNMFQLCSRGTPKCICRLTHFFVSAISSSADLRMYSKCKGFGAEMVL